MTDTPAPTKEEVEAMIARLNASLGEASLLWPKQLLRDVATMLRSLLSEREKVKPVEGGVQEAINAFLRREPDDCPWPEDSDLEAIWQEGVSWALGRVGKMLGIKDWDADGATESMEGDVDHEIGSIFATANLYDPETGEWITAQLSTALQERDAARDKALEEGAKHLEAQWEGGHCGESTSEIIARQRWNSLLKKAASALRDLRTTPAHPDAQGKVTEDILDRAYEAYSRAVVEGYSNPVHTQDTVEEVRRNAIRAALTAALEG